jgi:uncharacterized pyridoxamine 5'-phosphate oxidase family protein
MKKQFVLLKNMIRQRSSVMKMKRMISVLAAMALGVGVTACSVKAESKQEQSNLEFFQSLDFENGLDVVTKVFERYPLQYAATTGLDGNAQIRPIEFKFEEDGVLYFDTVTFYTSYKELQANPYIQLCVCDQETMTYVRLGGKVNFTDNPEIIDRCFENSPVLTSQFGDNREVVIGYYLTEVWAEFSSFSEELPSRSYSLTNKYDVDSDEQEEK